MNLLTIKLPDDQLQNFIVNGEADINLAMNSCMIHTEAEEKRINELSNDIAYLMRRGLIRYVNSQTCEAEGDE